MPEQKMDCISSLLHYYRSDTTLLIMRVIYEIADAVLWPLLDVRLGLMVRVEVHQTGPRRRLVFTLGTLGQSWLGKCICRSKQTHIYLAISLGTCFYRKLLIKDSLKLKQKVLALN